MPNMWQVVSNRTAGGTMLNGLFTRMKIKGMVKRLCIEIGRLGNPSMRNRALKTDLRLVSVEKEGETVQTSNLKPQGVYKPLLSKEEVENLSAFFEILNRINERERVC